MNYKKSLLALVFILPTGCSFIPDYERPQTVADADLTLRSGDSSRHYSLNDVFKNDPHLLEVLTHALAYNYDLQQSILRVESARNQKMSSIMELIPSVNATATKSISMSQSTSMFTGEKVKEKTSGYKSSLGVDSYEVDLWGKKLSVINALKHDEESYSNSVNAVRLTLMTDLASTWYETLSLVKIWHIYNEKISVINDIDIKISHLQRAERLEPLIYSKFIRGSSTDKYKKATLEKEIQNRIHKIEYLSGYQSSYINSHNWKLLDGDYIIPDIPQEIKTDVILKRPDVIAAEEIIKSANGSIGAARAAFLPIVNIYASAYQTSSNFDSALSNLSENWNLSPSVIIPIFSWPKYYTQLNYAMSQQKQSVLEYRKTVAQAMLDIKDANSNLFTFRIVLKATQAEVNMHELNFAKATNRYNLGYMDLYSYYESLELISAAKTEYESSRQQTMDGVIILLKSAGG